MKSLGTADDQESVVEDFRRLLNLLKSQEEALGRGDAQKLASLLPLLEDYNGRLAGHFASPPRGLGSDTRQELSRLRRDILDLAQSNARAYRRRKENLESSRRQLQSGSRYLKQFQSSTPRPQTGSRLQITG